MKKASTATSGTHQRFVGHDLPMIRHALSRAIEWNRDLIESHTPRRSGKNPHTAVVRKLELEIESWNRIILKLSNDSLHLRETRQ